MQCELAAVALVVGSLFESLDRYLVVIFYPGHEDFRWLNRLPSLQHCSGRLRITIPVPRFLIQELFHLDVLANVFVNFLCVVNLGLCFLSREKAAFLGYRREF